MVPVYPASEMDVVLPYPITEDVAVAVPLTAVGLTVTAPEMLLVVLQSLVFVITQ